MTGPDDDDGEYDAPVPDDRGPSGIPPADAPVARRVTFWVLVGCAHGSAAMAWAFTYFVQHVPDAQEDWSGAYGAGLAAGTAAFGAIVTLVAALALWAFWRPWGRPSRVVRVALWHLALAWFVGIAAAVTAG